MVEPERDKHQPIRSYVLRTGRMTSGQQRAFDENWHQFGLEYGTGMLDFDRVFQRPGSRVLEIGFGMGHSLADMAATSPQSNFVGIEVHRPGVGRLLHTLVQRDLCNVRIFCHDAVEVLRDCIPPASLDTVQIFFPDPWHKKRHHKRRLIQPAFTALVASRLRIGGTLHLATDWEHYAEQMMEVLTAEEDLANTCGYRQFAPRPPQRPLTKFELRGERLGHGVWDLIFRRQSKETA